MILFSLLAAAMMFTTPTPTQISQLPTEIIIIEGPYGEDDPRQQGPVPIIASVMGETIMVSFISDLGNVSVVLSEASEGTIYQAIVDSSDILAAIPFSGNAGNYTITFNLSSGVRYSGVLVI